MICLTETPLFVPTLYARRMEPGWIARDWLPQIANGGWLILTRLRCDCISEENLELKTPYRAPPKRESICLVLTALMHAAYGNPKTTHPPHASITMPWDCVTGPDLEPAKGGLAASFLLLMVQT